MRSRWFTLFRALLNVNFGLSAIRGRLRRRERVGGFVLTGLSAAAGVGIFVWFVSVIASATIDAGLLIGQPEIVLTLAHAAAVTIVFFFALAFLMSAFYFADDTRLLLALPLSPWEILAAKFASILVNEYLTIAPILLPVYAVYALKVPTGWWYAPAAAAVFLLTPVIPLAAAALITVVLMRWVSFARKRDFFTVVGSLAVVAFSLAFQYLSRRVLDGSESGSLEWIAGQAYGLSRMIAYGYPPSFWSTLVLVEGGRSAAGLGALAGLLLLSFGAVAGVLAAGERFFLPAAQAAGEVGSRRARRAVSYRASAPLWAIARAEGKLFLRTPIYVFNGLGGLIILPLFVLLPGLSGDERLAALIGSGGSNWIAGACVVWGWLVLAAGVSVIPATAVSREGKSLWIPRVLPLSARDFFLGKLLGAGGLAFVGALPGAAALAYAMRLPPEPFALGVVLGAASAAVVSMICLAIDFARPYLSWTEPARAMKSNVNGVLGSVASLAVVGGSVLLGRFAVSRGVSAEAALGAVALLHAMLGLLVWRWLEPRLDEFLARIGE